MSLPPDRFQLSQSQAPSFCRANSALQWCKRRNSEGCEIGRFPDTRPHLRCCFKPGRDARSATSQRTSPQCDLTRRRQTLTTIERATRFAIRRRVVVSWLVCQTVRPASAMRFQSRSRKANGPRMERASHLPSALRGGSLRSQRLSAVSAQHHLRTASSGPFRRTASPSCQLVVVLRSRDRSSQRRRSVPLWELRLRAPSASCTFLG